MLEIPCAGMILCSYLFVLESWIRIKKEPRVRSGTEGNLEGLIFQACLLAPRQVKQPDKKYPIHRCTNKSFWSKVSKEAATRDPKLVCPGLSSFYLHAISHLKNTGLHPALPVATWNPLSSLASFPTRSQCLVMSVKGRRVWDDQSTTSFK